MSIRVMSDVYDSDLTDIYEVSVMLALANHADDDGVCYPSTSRICELSRMKRRGVNGVIKRLQERGYLEVKMNAGPGGKNLYKVIPTPALRAPGTQCRPAPHRPGPRHPTHITPAPHADEPSITINEPSITDNAGAQPDKNSDPPDKPQKFRLPEGWVPSQQDSEYALSKNLNEAEIEEIAYDFHAYWTDRTDAGGRKSARGWSATWQGRVRDQAPKYIRNRRMAVASSTAGNRSGGGVAGEVARRRLGGQD